MAIGPLFWRQSAAAIDGGNRRRQSARCLAEAGSKRPARYGGLNRPPVFYDKKQRRFYGSVFFFLPENSRTAAIGENDKKKFHSPVAMIYIYNLFNF
jgi:hypothetical protein